MTDRKGRMIRVDPTVLEACDAKAKARGESFNSWVERVLRAQVEGRPAQQPSPAAQTAASQPARDVTPTPKSNW